MMFDRFKSRVQQGYKMVMMHNTGGLTQAFAAIRAAMLSQVTCPTPNEILNMIKNDATVSNNAWRYKFGLPEIHMMMELNQRAPMILRDTILAVDVMNDRWSSTRAVASQSLASAWRSSCASLRRGSVT